MSLSAENTKNVSADIPSLKARWEALTEADPKLRIYDAAQRLEVSEAELVATQVGESVQRLDISAKAFLEALPGIGEVMALTRNHWAVIEKVGVYESVEVGGHVSLVLGKDIDLRIFTKQWRHFFAVVGESRGRVLRSVQVFDGAGRAVHKVYLKDGGSLDAWEALIGAHLAEDQRPVFVPEPRAAKAEATSVESVDVDAFRREWLAMTDTHQFFGLLRRHGVTRTKALALAPPEMTHKVKGEAFVSLMSRAAETQTPIMVFVGNPGTIEIHTGVVHKLVNLKSWFNVMDPGFNLHLRTDGIAEVWVVRKPTEDGIVTSLELFDTEGETIAMIFGERKPGKPELESWRALIKELL